MIVQPPEEPLYFPLIGLTQRCLVSAMAQELEWVILLITELVV